MAIGMGGGAANTDLHTIRELLAQQLSALELSLGVHTAIVAHLDLASPAASEQAQGFDEGETHFGTPAQLFQHPPEPATNVDADELVPRKPSPAVHQDTTMWDNLQALAEPLLAPADQDVEACNFAPSISPESSAGLRTDFLEQVQAMKTSVGQAGKEPVFNVEDLYSSKGLWQRVAKDPRFNQVTFFVIIISTIWIGIDTDYNTSDDTTGDSPLIFLVADNMFCSYFLVEIVIRFLAFHDPLDVVKDVWFAFDAFLVVIVVWGTWLKPGMQMTMGDNGFDSGQSYGILRLFRIVRLLRIFRTARLLKAMPALRILIKAMMTAMRSTMSILCLLGIFIYVFAVLFTQQLSNTEVGEDKFTSVPEAMNFLLLATLCGSDAAFVTKLLDEHWLYYVLYLLFMFIGTQTILNMLIGVICEVVSVVAQQEEEDMFVDFAVPRISELIDSMDEDGSKSISKEEFLHLLGNQTVLRTLQAEGVDVVSLVDFTPLYFRNDEEISFADFLEMVTQLRGSKVATVKDLVDVRKFMSMELRQALMGSPLAPTSPRRPSK